MIHYYARIKTLEKFYCISNGLEHRDIDDLLRNKVNELVVGYNRLAKDLELYKKAYKALNVSRPLELS
jgi:hypothetical protein